MIGALVPLAAPQTRCVCCGAQARASEPDGWERCTWCDLAADPALGLSSPALARELASAISAGVGPPEGAKWRAPERSLRILASGAGLWLEGRAEHQHSLPAPSATLALAPLATGARVPVTLAVLARDGDPQLSGLLARLASQFRAVVVIEDAPTSAPTQDGNLTVIRQPLDGDFAAQRNRANRAVADGWVLHLDTDERVSADFCTALPYLAARAQASGFDTVGFARRNIVDGTLSDLFPDIQYRLMHRDVRFEGHVHERPASCADGATTTVSQHGAIDHMLDRDRVIARRDQYDRMGQSADRHGDDLALLRPFAS